MKKSILAIATTAILIGSISTACLTANAAQTHSQAKENLEKLLIQNYWDFNNCTKENGVVVKPNAFYTESSYNNYLVCYEKSMSLCNDNSATDDSIVEITNQFTEAKAALVRNNVEMTADNTANSKEQLCYILTDNSWDFDYTPEYWYAYYTKESYDEYVETKNNSWVVYESTSSIDSDYNAAWQNFIYTKWHLIKVEATVPTTEAQETTLQQSTTEVTAFTDPITESLSTTETITSTPFSAESTNKQITTSKQNATAATVLKQNTDTVKTGSQSNVFMLCGVLLSSILAFGLVCRKRKE